MSGERFNLDAKEGDFGYDKGEVLFDKISRLVHRSAVSSRGLWSIDIIGIRMGYGIWPQVCGFINTHHRSSSVQN